MPSRSPLDRDDHLVECQRLSTTQVTFRSPARTHHALMHIGDIANIDHLHAGVPKVWGGTQNRTDGPPALPGDTGSV